MKQGSSTSPPKRVRRSKSPWNPGWRSYLDWKDLKRSPCWSSKAIKLKNIIILSFFPDFLYDRQIKKGPCDPSIAYKLFLTLIKCFKILTWGPKTILSWVFLIFIRSRNWKFETKMKIRKSQIFRDDLECLMERTILQIVKSIAKDRKRKLLTNKLTICKF